MLEEDGGSIFNSIVVVGSGCLIGRYRKIHLLDGERIFCPGTEHPVFDERDLRFGINTCYDTNFMSAVLPMADRGATLIFCPANNMMRREKAERYRDLHNASRAKRCRDTSRREGRTGLNAGRGRSPPTVPESRR
ncbi:carbon-nitrogen hydrolase family protein [Rhizobium gallicum]|uniref:carbon-nitrogen hydrolase family protein n=1 Tax=Rhizobium gallicum TaxID=56730 RepID=UPI003B8A7399